MNVLVTHNIINDPANLSLRIYEMVDSHKRRAGILVSQDDVDEAVNKAADAQLEAEAAHERAKKAERTANDFR